MAIIPDPGAIRREDIRPNTSVATYDGTVAGRALAQYGSEVAQMAEKESQRIDNSIVENALTELKQRRALLTYGDKGYKSVKGGNVVITPDGEKPFTERYSAQFDQVSEALSAKLSPSQKAIFNASATRERVAFQADVLQHAMSETDQFHAEADQGAITAAQQTAVLDPSKVHESLAEMDRIAGNMIQNHGVAADKAQAILAAKRSDMHQAIIANLAVSDPQGAKAYYDFWEKQILDKSVGKNVTHAADTATAQQTGHAAAWSAINSGKQKDDAYRALDEDPFFKGRPDMLAQARHEIDTQFAVKHEGDQARAAGPILAAIQGKSLNEIMQMPGYTQGTDVERASIIQHVRAEQDRRRGKAEEVTPAKLASYHDILNDGQKLAGMTNNAIAVEGSKRGLTNAMISNLMDTAQEYRAAPSKIVEAKVDADAIDTAYWLETKKSPNDKKNRDDVGVFRDFVKQNISAAQQTLRRELTPQEKKDIITRAAHQIVVQKGWFSDTTAGVYSPGVQKARQYLIARGADPSKIVESDIQAVYKEANK